VSAINRDDLIDGRYRIQSRLGTGGMADVYLAEDRQLERQIALKMLHRRFAEDPGFVERFRREAQSAAGLQHPNVVSVYDRGAWDGTYYIAMEYLPGRTLKQVVRDEAPLDSVRAVDIVIQVLKATRFAHRRGIIHRDLKPHNVMLGDQDHAKVTDFGIARAGASDMTETGSIMGTAQYLSPEQAQGLAVAEGSDLYSVGIILYELLTGHVPFDAESAVTIALKHVSEAPTPPSAYNPEIPPTLEQTVLWALNKNPADRPQDADQFINVLEAVRESLLSGQGGQVTASMTALGAGAGAAALAGGAAAGNVTGPHPRIQLGTHTVSTASTAMAPVLSDTGALSPVSNTTPPGVGFGGPGAPGGPGGPERGEPRRRSRWSRIWPWLLGIVVLLAIAGGVVAFVLTRPSNGTVPVVVRLTQASATQEVESAGFNPQVLPSASKAAQGTVIAQNPLGGTREKRGATVTLTVSSGPGSTTVPPVTQLSEKAAEARLHAAGLVVSKILSEPSSTIKKNEVTKTLPNAGVTLQAGQGVDLYLSSGVAPVSLPDVQGDSLSAAQSALAQFDVSVTQQPSATVAANTVISQTPTGGTAALPHSKVTLVVAEKEPSVTVPNLVGDTVAEAESTLTGLGLMYARTIKLTSNPGQDGQVLAQSPANGTTTQGSTVTLTVGQYSLNAPSTGTTTTSSGTGTGTGTTTTPAQTITTTSAPTTSTPAASTPAVTPTTDARTRR
jgi:beta-lactam-binding protein with PASTA domain/predicted Ser/Thr protein kinase